MKGNKFNNSEILIHQCNHWFNEYSRLINENEHKKNHNLIIEALGCAKGSLCALKEIDPSNKSLYEDILSSIDFELNKINSKSLISKNTTLSNIPIFLDLKSYQKSLIN